MNIREWLEKKKYRTEIALQEVLKFWQPEVQTKYQCPFCQSFKVFKRCRASHGNTYICRECNQNFSEELIPECRCWIPGRFPKCQGCPHFRSVLLLIKEKDLTLKELSLQELKSLRSDK